MVSARDWSDTTTFLLEAEVFHPMVSQVVHESYPVIFGDGLNFTLPSSAEGVSTVSYTHLDVYKRQAWELGNKRINMESSNNPGELLAGVRNSRTPVMICLLYTSRCV